MDRSLKLLCAVLALLLHEQAASQQAFKCKDAADKITYAGKPCAELGLIPVGEVQNRITVSPRPSVPPSQPAAAPVAPPTEAKPPASADTTPPAPERRCFVVKTEKGTATRCNDTPTE